jgi:hypothetical protein
MLQQGGVSGVFTHLQAQAAQAAGARALLVYDDQISDYFVPASDGTITGISIPSGSIPRRTGQLLVSSLLVLSFAQPLKAGSGLI